jgi:hypothetical protein
MSPTTKEAARAEWHRRIQARIGTVPPPPSEPMERWIRYNQALARYAPNFHGGITMAYNHGPAAFEAVLGALQNGYEAAAGPHTRRPTFRGV